MPGCEIWDLVKVPFPYTARPVQQRRPALVVAIPQTENGPALLWVLMVTSADNRSWSTDVPISDAPETGLPAPSIVRVAKIATIEQGDTERLGRLPKLEQAAVARSLHEYLPKS